MTGIELITKERQVNQIAKHGFTAAHHANHPEWYAEGQLINAAHMISAYDPEDGLTSNYKEFCPLNWDLEWWKRLCDEPVLRRFAMAGAFIAAEIDRQIFERLRNTECISSEEIKNKDIDDVIESLQKLKAEGYKSVTADSNNVLFLIKPVDESKPYFEKYGSIERQI